MQPHHRQTIIALINFQNLQHYIKASNQNQNRNWMLDIMQWNFGQYRQQEGSMLFLLTKQIFAAYTGEKELYSYVENRTPKIQKHPITNEIFQFQPTTMQNEYCRLRKTSIRKITLNQKLGLIAILFDNPNQIIIMDSGFNKLYSFRTNISNAKEIFFSDFRHILIHDEAEEQIKIFDMFGNQINNVLMSNSALLWCAEKNLQNLFYLDREETVRSLEITFTT